MFILSLQHIPKAKDTRFHNYMLLNFEAEAKSLRPKPKGPEADAKILASRPVWPQSFNISGCVNNTLSLFKRLTLL